MSTWLSITSWKLLCHLIQTGMAVITPNNSKAERRAARTLIKRGYAVSEFDPEIWDDIDNIPVVTLTPTITGENYVTNRRRKL